MSRISDAEARHILEQRARELAREPRVRLTRGGEYLTLRVADETLALPVPALLHVLKEPKLAPLPGSVLPLIGVTGWRGELLMVFDISATPGPEATEARYVLVLAHDPAVGVRVDAVDDVVEIATTSIQPLAAARAHRAYARGVSGSVVVIDAAALLQSLTQAEAS